MKVSNGTSTHKGEQLCKIILKFIHEYKSYAPDKARWMDGTDGNTDAHYLSESFKWHF